MDGATLSAMTHRSRAHSRHLCPTPVSPGHNRQAVNPGAYAMTKAEQETILRWSADDEIVSIFTAHPPAKRKLERAGYRPTKISTVGAEVGWFYRVPVSELRWRVGAKKRPSRPMTEEQRQAVADRLTRARV